VNKAEKTAFNRTVCAAPPFGGSGCIQLKQQENFMNHNATAVTVSFIVTIGFFEIGWQRDGSGTQKISGVPYRNRPGKKAKT